MALPKRKHPRLKNYDYGQCGCYHITICVKDRHPILSTILPARIESERASIQLHKPGYIAQQFILNIPLVYTGVFVEHYVIMPNHIHILLRLSTESTATIPTIIRSFKRMTTREIGMSVWQDSYYDVIIRNDSMFQSEWSYIDCNPDKWAEDPMYVTDL